MKRYGRKSAYEGENRREKPDFFKKKLKNGNLLLLFSLSLIIILGKPQKCPANGRFSGRASRSIYQKEMNDEKKSWVYPYRTPRGYYLLNIRFVYDNTLSQHREEIKAGNESI